MSNNKSSVLASLPEELFSGRVIRLIADETQWHNPVSPAEEAQIRQAVPKRQREFRAGRHCARLALRQLHQNHFDLLNDAERVPQWPQNIVGSISHCDDLCIVAVSDDPTIKALGLDVEALSALPAETRALICHPQEIAQLIDKTFQEPYWDRVIFSAKESFYKAYFPLCRQFLDFLDAEVTLEAPHKTAHGFQGNYRLRLLNSPPPALSDQHVFYGRYACIERWIITSMTLLKTTENEE